MTTTQTKIRARTFERAAQRAVSCIRRTDAEMLFSEEIGYSERGFWLDLMFLDLLSLGCGRQLGMYSSVDPDRCAWPRYQMKF